MLYPESLLMSNGVADCVSKVKKKVLLLPSLNILKNFFRSGLWIRIRIGNPDPGARKLRNFSGKMDFVIIFFKITTKKE
jgi:hypothetical protein